MNLPITQTGKRIQNYVFNYAQFLGAGNFSKCYKGCNEITNEVVAIKIVELNSLKSKKLEELLFQEIQILKKLNHPSVLKCFEIFTSNRNCYIITELCNQGNLENRLKMKKVFDQSEANPIIKDVYDGLLYLSQNNIVHRDLKSANIFLHNGRAKIADFGFAKEISHNFKDLNIGSPLYMAPQGILHNIYGPKTEVWALGILVYELYHGSSPYIYCKTEEQLRRSVTIPLNWKQLRKDLSQDIKEFILTCLQINEQKRATIEQLGNLGYIRRLNQVNFSNRVNKFDFRSHSKSVHLNSNNENENNFSVEKPRVNNNFRAQNNMLNRQVGRSRTNDRQVVFRSVDMKASTNNNNSRSTTQQHYQSPKKPPTFGGIGKFEMNSPTTRRPHQLPNPMRPLSSNHQQHLYPNPNTQQQPQPLMTTSPSQQFSLPLTIANQQQQSYQYRMYQQQQPMENKFVVVQSSVGGNGMKPMEIVMGQMGDGYQQGLEVSGGGGGGGRQGYSGGYQGQSGQQVQVQQVQIQQLQHQQQAFDMLAYNSMNGFTQSFNSTNQFQPIADSPVLPLAQQNPFFSQSQPIHQRTKSSTQPPDHPPSYTFRDRITFKQAIFFIHHCRLLFKFLFMYKEAQSFDQQLYLKLFKYLMSLLGELNKLAEANGVVAEGEKSGLKVKKFRQVNLQYLLKYRKELQSNNYTITPEPITQSSLHQTTLVLNQIFYRLDEEIMQGLAHHSEENNSNCIVLGHLCVVIMASMREIGEGIERRSFGKLLEFKLIEVVLNTAKEKFTVDSYLGYKERYLGGG